MTFRDAVLDQMTETTNGMPARVGSADSCVDLFYKIGASRGQNILPQFVAAYAQDPFLALRIAAWVRDVRGGAGERQIFRDILALTAVTNQEAFGYLVHKISEVGRWDDLEAVLTLDPRIANHAQRKAVMLWAEAIGFKRDALACKWAPRKGPVAEMLRKTLGLSPRNYRKLIVAGSRTVETQMCARDWDNINFSHVPSVASARYRKAFHRHTTKYAEWCELLKQRDPAVAKVNAAAIFPHDVVHALSRQANLYGPANELLTNTEIAMIEAQWDALPNYIGDKSCLAMVDVSGSMTQTVNTGSKKGSNVLAIDVAVALGMYCADKNRGAFKDLVLTFSDRPELLHLRGSIAQKYMQLNTSSWTMNTNLEAAMALVLKTAVQGNVAPEDMPGTLLILSDMQFDECVLDRKDSAIEMMRRQYEAAGYAMPRIVFWNLVAHENVPVKHNERGAALVSGFSPAILKAVLKADFDQFTPRNVMLQAVMDSRYDPEPVV